MLYRSMPKLNQKLSILGFGCMRLPQKRGRIDETRAARQIHDAIESGINYFDTAYMYHMGASEPFLGTTLQGGYRERVYIATKLPHWMTSTKEQMHQIFEMQCNNLKTDHIDFYLIHNLNGRSWKASKNAGVIEFLNELKHSGKISASGFSFHGALPDFKTIVDDYDWDFCQIQYNYLDIENQAGEKGLAYAAHKNLGIIVMEPLRGGHLAAPIPPAIQSIWNQFKDERTPAEWALRWIWNQPDVTLVLSGMNEEKHIEENIRVACNAHAHSLSDDEYELIQTVAQNYRNLMKSNCTGCRYCLPCPHGVDIPVCFDNYDTYHLFDKRFHTKMVYTFFLGGFIDGKPGLASQCTRCGECLEKCPQGILIPDVLDDVKKEMEGIHTKPLIGLARIGFAIQKKLTFRRAQKT